MYIIKKPVLLCISDEVRVTNLLFESANSLLGSSEVTAAVYDMTSLA